MIRSFHEVDAGTLARGQDLSVDPDQRCRSVGGERGLTEKKRGRCARAAEIPNRDRLEARSGIKEQLGDVEIAPRQSMSPVRAVRCDNGCFRMWIALR